MSKRFRSTKLSREAWYRKLKPAFKCTWDFLCDECDEAGIWSIDLDALEFYIGEAIDLNVFIEKVNEDRPKDNPRVELYGNDKVFVTGFVDFQYGQLSEACIPHRKIITLLKKYNLFDRVCIPYTKGTSTLQEKKGKEEEGNGKEEGGTGGKHSRRPKLAPAVPDEKALKGEYDAVIENVKQMTEVKTQKEALAKFIQDNKPQFVEPYADLWNLSVQPYGISQVETFSDGRLKRFKSRVREPSFDFIKILSEIRLSDYLRGKKIDWKIDWDWIMENDTNFIKIIEGKYRNAQN